MNTVMLELPLDALASPGVSPAEMHRAFIANDQHPLVESSRLTGDSQREEVHSRRLARHSRPAPPISWAAATFP